MKRILICFLIVLLALSTFSSCSDGGEDDGALLVICTSFSWYDWAREIVGESDGVTLRLLADGGKDMHSYSPSAADMMAILSCELLIYGGGVSETWVEELAEEGKLRSPLSLMALLGEDVKCVESHEEHEHSHEEHAHGEVDEHIWLSLKNAARFCEAIRDALCRLDAENARTYTENCALYLEKLSALDGEFAALASGAAQKTVLVADRNPYRYLFGDYGILCHAAFEGCSTESDAGVSTVIELSKTLDALGLGGVLVTETSDGRLARTLVENSAAKNAEVYVLHALQSVPDAENTSYLAVMQENLGVLQEVLG